MGVRGLLSFMQSNRQGDFFENACLKDTPLVIGEKSISKIHYTFNNESNFFLMNRWK
jgi:hypothetical protein